MILLYPIFAIQQVKEICLSKIDVIIPEELLHGYLFQNIHRTETGTSFNFELFSRGIDEQDEKIIKLNKINVKLNFIYLLSIYVKLSSIL